MTAACLPYGSPMERQDILIRPDGGWCFRDELHETPDVDLSHRSIDQFSKELSEIVTTPELLRKKISRKKKSAD